MHLTGLLDYLKHLPAYRGLLAATPEAPQALLPSARPFVAAGLRAHTGKAVVPGQPDASLLIKAVRYADENMQMPPSEKLSDDEIKMLTVYVHSLGGGQ